MSTRIYPFVLAGLLTLGAAGASAGVVVGPGDVGSTINDTNPQLAIVDLNNEITLAAGTYAIATFDAAFTTTGTGVLIPFLVADAAGTYTPLAIGTSYTSFTSGGGFQSRPFGGVSSFTLAATTVVAPGLEWTQGTANMPVGFNAGGSVFAFYDGAPTPVIGTPLAPVASAGSFVRTYDFSFTLSAAPEPSSWALIVVGFGAIGVALRSRRRSAHA